MANKNVELMRGNPEKAVKTLAIPIMISMLYPYLHDIEWGKCRSWKWCYKQH